MKGTAGTAARTLGSGDVVAAAAVVVVVAWRGGRTANSEGSNSARDFFLEGLQSGKKRKWREK